MKNKGLFTLIGFVLFISGLLSLVLSFVGIELAYLQWLSIFGNLGAFLAKIVMVILGVVIVVVARSDEDFEERLERVK